MEKSAGVRMLWEADGFGYFVEIVVVSARF